MQIVKNTLKKIRDRMSSYNSTNARLKDNEEIKSKMYNPDKKIEDLLISKKVKGWYEELSKNGIIKIENEFEWVHKIYNEDYFNNTNNKYFLSDDINDRAIKTGRTFAKTVSLGDPKLFEWYFNKDLLTLIAKIFKQQPFYRNQPILQTYKFKDNHTEDIAAKWHIDSNLHQITFMLLLNDITINDTHMEFALESIKEENKELNRDIINNKNIEDKFQIISCIGKAGTLFGFCGGMGYHRAVYKKSTVRSIYHANFTPGHDIIPEFLEDRNNIIELSNQPFFIKHIPCALFKENPHNHLLINKKKY
tara:strand:- start:621 stop:1538 length:918 start_codon:yes stop_codon:yes gene_type:complete